MAQPPKVLVINYNENNQSPDKDKVNEIINKIKDNDIFILTTQYSPSGTDSHIHHSIKDQIKNNPLLQKYELFSKIDATRKSDSEYGFFKKLYNVRTRIWINKETVYKSFIKNFSNNKFTSKIVLNNPKTYENYNTSVGTNRIKNSNGDSTILNSNLIRIEDYTFRRITSQNKNGDGSIMISISLLGKDNNTYQYIVCNLNPKGSLIKNANGTEKVFINMIKPINVMENIENVRVNLTKTAKSGIKSFFGLSKPNQTEEKIIQKITKQIFKGTIYILYVSKNNYIFKKLQKNTDYNFNKVRYIQNIKSNTKNGNDGLTFEQIDTSEPKKSMMSFFSNKFSKISTSNSGSSSMGLSKKQNLTETKHIILSNKENFNRNIKLKFLINDIYNEIIKKRDFNELKVKYKKEEKIKTVIQIIDNYNITKSNNYNKNRYNNESNYEYILRKLKEYSKKSPNDDSFIMLFEIFEKFMPITGFNGRIIEPNEPKIIQELKEKIKEMDLKVEKV
jgi:hypothetical protein